MTNSSRQSQCPKCHRFLTGASSPEVGHQGTPGGSVCSLPHHPEPCTFSDDSGAICTFYESCSMEDDAVVTAATGGLEAAQLQQQLVQLQQEKEAESRRANLLQLSNTNLQQTQARLQAEVSQLGVFSSIASGSFPPTTTTTTVTPSTTAPRMGTGFSQSFSSPSLYSGVSHFPSSLNSAAASLVASNATPNPPPSSIYGYTGPTLPELRSNPQTSDLASQVFSVLMREIPALSASTAASAVPPHPTSYPSYPSYPSPLYPAPPPPRPGSVPPGGLPPARPAASVLPAMVSAHPAAAALPTLFSHPQQSLGVTATQLTPEQLHIQQLQRQIHEMQALHGQQSSNGEAQEDSSQVSSRVSLDSLYSATIKCAQYRAIDFCKLGNFTYSSQIKPNNLNLALFSYGSLKHILALNDILAKTNLTLGFNI